MKKKSNQNKTVFVDDMEENVEAAFSLGIKRIKFILFEDPESLAKKFVSYSLLYPLEQSLD